MMETKIDNRNDNAVNGAVLEQVPMTDITEIIKEREAPLLRYAGRLIRDSETARDVVQEVFIKYVRISQDQGRAKIDNIPAWLYRVTRNLCLDHLKSKRIQLEIPIDENIANVAGGESPDSTLEKKDAMTLVRKKLMELEPRDREVVILKVEHGRSYKEISEIMGISVTNVGFILHTAIKKLAKDLKAAVN
ncbi:MAG: RNA polymerase sigma factor [Lentisphaerae bacterium]|nr:RNA polymerase sigma factor [Lentisphaerota bacterium]